MLRIAFSRTAIIVVALLLQLFVFFASFYWLKDYSTVVYAAFVLLGAVSIIVAVAIATIGIETKGVSVESLGIDAVTSK